jgi:hypothetical protein
VARAAASGAAAAQARHEQQAAAEAAAAVAGEDDVLAGLQLAEGGEAEAAPSQEGSGSLGLEPAQTSFPTTPLGLAVPGEGEGLGSAAREGSLPALTPLGGGSQSPALLEPLTVGAEEEEAAAGCSAQGGAGSGGLAGGEEGQQAQQGGSTAQRELSFEAAAEQQAAAAAVSAADAEQQRQEQAAQAAAAAAVAAAVAAQPYEEPLLIEEMVAEGTRHVLAAEAAGQLQQRYPYMYAQAEDLSVAEVEGVLVGYKELLLRYEALSRALQQQLGLLPGAAPADGGSSTSGSPAGLSTSPGHRSKGQQAAQGFGSIVLTATDAGIGHARRVISAPIAVAAPAADPAAGSAPGSADASPSGKWSPGGILQRISKGASAARRSMTPPRDRSGSRAAVAAEAAVPSADVVARSPNSSRAASPGGKPGQPFFSTLFGSPKNANAHQQAAEQQAAEQQVLTATVAGKQPGSPQPPEEQWQPSEPASDVGEAAAAPSGSSGEPTPELSFGGGLLSPADTPDAPATAEADGEIEAAQSAPAPGSIDQLLGDAPVKPQAQQEGQLEQQAAPTEADMQQQQAAGSSALDLIQLGASRSSSQQVPAAADAAAGPDLLLSLGVGGEAQPQLEGSDAQPDTSLI